MKKATAKKAKGSFEHFDHLFRNVISVSNREVRKKMEGDGLKPAEKKRGR